MNKMNIVILLVITITIVTLIINYDFGIKEAKENCELICNSNNMRCIEININSRTSVCYCKNIDGNIQTYVM